MASSDEHFREGVRLMASGRNGDAIACFRQAVEIQPRFPEAHNNLGILLGKQGNEAQAEVFLRLALLQNPESPEILSNLADLLSAGGRFDEAETLYRRSLTLCPLPATLSNFAVLLACLKREEEAEACFRAALELDPENPRTRFNFSYLLLRNGKFGEGWQALESRHAALINVPELPFRRWQGEPLSGKSLFVWPELGFGDQIQFCRYLPLLHKAGAARIVLACSRELQALFETLEGVEVREVGIPEEHFDFWTMPLSIPSRLDPDFIPADIPYLRPHPERIEKWKHRIPDEGKRKVGLVWKGNPLHENDAKRSLPSLSALAPLRDVPDVSFFSLQKEKAGFSPLPLADLGAEIADFADSAAIVSMLDLVICVDTSIAHLAGAIGKPCWVMLPDFKTDWRWLKDRTDSPWYPTLRLFRQKSDWGSLILEVRDALLP